MNEYTFIPKDKTEALWDAVDKWFDNSPAKSNFADAKGICKTAVGEYLANQMGHTLYVHSAKRDADWYAREEALKILEEEKRAEAERIEREKREARRKKEEAEYQAAVSKLTPKELKIIKKRQYYK